MSRDTPKMDRGSYRTLSSNIHMNTMGKYFVFANFVRPLVNSQQDGANLAATKDRDDTSYGYEPGFGGEKMSPPQWAHLIAGASGGLATAFVTSPLDVLRTRLQSDVYQSSAQHPAAHGTRPLVSSSRAFGNPLRHLHETFQIIQSIQLTEGWRGFFRGLGPSLSGVVPATAIKFYVYGNFKRLGAHVLGRSEDSAVVHAQAAIAAGIATATATNPIWLVKTRLQLDVSRAESTGTAARRYKNSFDCLRQVLRQEGIKGLYRGLSASYLGTIETALHLVLYERIKLLYARALSGTGVPDGAWGGVAKWIGTSGAAGSAKLAAVLIAYPHEVVRTRLRQAPMENGVLKYTGLTQCFRSIWREQGLVGLYGGLTPHMMRSIPSAIITLGVYEFVLSLAGS